jgi:myo-inositol catabolism protein IolH
MTSPIRIALDPAMCAPRPVDDAMRAAAVAGYVRVELGNRPDLVPAFGPPVTPEAELRRIAGLAADLSIEIASVAVIQAWSDPDEAVRRRAVGWWRAGIEAVAAMGATRINTELSGDPERAAASRDAFLRSFGELGPDLADAGLSVAVEPHPNDFVETTAEALEIVEAAGDARLGYLHCIPHAFHLGGTTADQVALAASRFDHVHLADAFRPERTILNPASPRVRVHQHLDPGQGEIDFGEVARALGRAKFDGLLTVQVFAWPDRPEASFLACRLAAERLVVAIEAARPGGPDAVAAG